MPLFSRLLLLLMIILLSACVETDSVKPAFVIENAHSSGSLVAVDAQRPLAASAGLEGTLSLWDLETGRQLAAWKGHQGTVNGLALSSRQARLVSGSWDGTLAAWNLQGKLIRRVSAGAPVTAMASTEDLTRIWTGHADGTLRLWNGELALLGERRVPVKKRITALALAGEYLAAADSGGNLWLFDGPGEQEPRRLASLPAYLRTLVFNSDGSELFGGSCSWFQIYRWNPRSGEMTRLDTPHRGIIASLAWSPSGHELMSISRQTDSSVLALDPGSGALREDYGKHDLCGASVAVTADGRYLITTSDDASVRIWHLDPNGVREIRP